MSEIQPWDPPEEFSDPSKLAPADRATDLIDRLPDKVVVACNAYALEKWSGREAQMIGRFGECDNNGQRISIDRALSTPAKAVDTVLHEVLHAVWYTYVIKHKKMSEEAMVSILATALTAVFSANPWLPDWIKSARMEDDVAFK